MQILGSLQVLIYTSCQSQAGKSSSKPVFDTNRSRPRIQKGDRANSRRYRETKHSAKQTVGVNPGCMNLSSDPAEQFMQARILKKIRLAVPDTLIRELHADRIGGPENHHPLHPVRELICTVEPICPQGSREKALLLHRLQCTSTPA